MGVVTAKTLNFLDQLLDIGDEALDVVLHGAFLGVPARESVIDGLPDVNSTDHILVHATNDNRHFVLQFINDVGDLVVHHCVELVKVGVERLQSGSELVKRNLILAWRFGLTERLDSGVEVIVRDLGVREKD